MKRSTLNKLVLALGLVGLLFSFTACAGHHKVGGPCKYQSMDTTLTVLSIDSEFVTSDINGIGERKLLISDFASTPSTGDSYFITVDTITQGTCTPHIYQVGAHIKN